MASTRQTSRRSTTSVGRSSFARSELYSTKRPAVVIRSASKSAMRRQVAQATSRGAAAPILVDAILGSAPRKVLWLILALAWMRSFLAPRRVAGSGSLCHTFLAKGRIDER
jgi:hypothetical protein